MHVREFDTYRKTLRKQFTKLVLEQIGGSECIRLTTCLPQESKIQHAVKCKASQSS